MSVIEHAAAQLAAAMARVEGELPKSAELPVRIALGCLDVARQTGHRHGQAVFAVARAIVVLETLPRVGERG